MLHVYVSIHIEKSLKEKSKMDKWTQFVCLHASSNNCGWCSNIN